VVDDDGIGPNWAVFERTLCVHFIETTGAHTRPLAAEVNHRLELPISFTSHHISQSRTQLIVHGRMIPGAQDLLHFRKMFASYGLREADAISVAYALLHDYFSFILISFPYPNIVCLHVSGNGLVHLRPLYGGYGMIQHVTHFSCLLA
jgi:hypothetical protein